MTSDEQIKLEISHPSRETLINSIKRIMTNKEEILYDKAHYYEISYRIASWSLDDTKNVALFSDKKGEIYAIFYFQFPFWSIDYFVKKDLNNRVWKEYFLPWIHGRNNEIKNSEFGHIKFHLWFTSGHEIIKSIIKPSQLSNWNVYHFRYNLSSEIMNIPDIEDNYTIRPIYKNELQNYVDLHRRVFQSRNMTLGWRKKTLEMPNYDNKFDLVLEHKTEGLIGFCIFWLDLKEKIAKLEPLGIDERFRGLNLGKAMILTGLNKLKSVGIKLVYVTTDEERPDARGIYSKVGFEFLYVFNSIQISN